MQLLDEKLSAFTFPQLSELSGLALRTPNRMDLGRD
jgi:hypothetical protein